MDGQHVCSGLRQRRTSADILWLQLKAKPSRAPLCVVSCFASVHSQPNDASFTVSCGRGGGFIVHVAGLAVDTAHVASVTPRARRVAREAGASAERAAANAHVCTLSPTRSVIAPPRPPPAPPPPTHHGTHVRQETRRKPQQSRKCIIRFFFKFQRKQLETLFYLCSVA